MRNQGVEPAELPRRGLGAGHEVHDRGPELVLIQGIGNGPVEQKGRVAIEGKGRVDLPLVAGPAPPLPLAEGGEQQGLKELLIQMVPPEGRAGGA